MTTQETINDMMQPLGGGVTTAADDTWQWAIVEIFGHRSHAGRTREEERFGAKMLRIDVPIYVGKQEGETWPPKIVDLHLDRWETHYYGGSAIFSFTPAHEADVMKIAEREAKIDPPARYRLPSPPPEPAGHDEYENGDDDEEDHDRGQDELPL